LDGFVTESRTAAAIRGWLGDVFNPTDCIGGFRDEATRHRSFSGKPAQVGELAEGFYWADINRSGQTCFSMQLRMRGTFWLYRL
jgi:hypothetical protein